MNYEGIIFKHFKGGFYEILHEAKNSEDLSIVIVYKSLKDGGIWTRPKKEFFEEIDTPSGKVPRFKSQEVQGSSWEI